jgi:hypothetical protein
MQVSEPFFGQHEAAHNPTYAISASRQTTVYSEEV